MYNFKNMNLSTKTAIIILVMLLIIFIILISFTVSSTRKAIQASVEDELRSMSKCNGLQVQRVMDMTQSTAYNINNYIQKQYKRAEKQLDVTQSDKNISVIYNSPISNMNFEIENYITENARNAAATNPDVVGVGVLFEPYKFDKNIKDYAFYISETDKEDVIEPFGFYSDYSKEEYYTKAVREKEMVFTKPYNCKGLTVVTAATPIIHNNDIKGVIVSDFDVSNLSRLYSKNENYPSLYTTIFDQNGVLIYDSQVFQDIGKNMAEFYKKDEWNKIKNNMKKEKDFSLDITYDGEKELGFFYPIKAGNTYWWSLMEVEKKDINNKINTTIFWLLIICVLALTIIVITIIVVLRKMLNPIQNVVQAAKDIANGNFDINIPISSQDEVGQLSSSFVEMAQKIKIVQHELILKNVQLEETIEKLNKSDAANSAKNIFIANISHEFRTPITLILSIIQLFQMNLLYKKDEKTSKYLQIMKQNCYRLLRLINNLIDISRIEAGFNQLNLKNVDIVKLVSDIVMSITEYAEEKNICVQFSTNIEEMKVSIDPDKMERILLNLLSNSIKFTPHGGQIIANIYKKDNSVIMISVKDTGIGIPKENIDLVFNRFHQVDTTHARMNEGSGIGLSLVKAFIEMQGGKINIYSELGKGSEFIIELPIILYDNEESSQSITSQDGNKIIEKLDIEFSDIYYSLSREA